MSRIKTREFTCFCGMAGSGKTYAIREFIKRIPDTVKVKDANGNEEERPKLLIYDFNGVDYPGHPYRWVPQAQTDADFHTFLNYAYQKGNCVVVLEEFDMYSNDHDKVQARFFRTARNRGVGAILSSKRIKDSIKPRFRNRVNKYFIFKTVLPEDIEYLEKLCGLPKGTLSNVPNLQVGEYYEFDMATHTLSPKQKINVKRKGKGKRKEHKNPDNDAPSVPNGGPSDVPNVPGKQEDTAVVPTQKVKERAR